MPKTFISQLGLLLILLLGGCSTATPTASPTTSSITPSTIAPTVPVSVPAGKIVVGYYPSWAAARNVFLNDAPHDGLTHINYAFSNVSEGGECILGDPAADVERIYQAAVSVTGLDDEKSALFHGNFNQLLALKQKYPDLKVLISIGGWSWSGNFSAAAKDDASRQRFASSCIELYLVKYKGVFDGLDVDWEYPVSGGLTSGSAADKTNYTLLLGEIRRQLDVLGTAENRHYLLTIAAPVGPGVIRNMDLENIAPIVDWINLMSYDFHGTWDSTTNFNAPLYRTSTDPADAALNVDAAVQTYLSSGVPAEKLVLGVPFYGRGWSGVANVNQGLYQPASGAAPGSLEPGAYDYVDISKNQLSAFTRYWSAEAFVPWLYDPVKQIFISYDDAQSLEAKAGYAHDQGLAGVMIWDISQGDENLLNAIHQGFEMCGPDRPTLVPIEVVARPFEAEIHMVRGITLDGVIDEWPAEPDFTLNEAAQIVYTATPKSWGGAQDLSARAWVGWSADGLYFAFDVLDDLHVQTAADDTLWHGDHMELQFDTLLDKDYDNPGMNYDDYQIGLSLGSLTDVPPVAYAWFNGAEAAGAAETIQMAYLMRDGGYTLEVFVPVDALAGLSLVEGATFGMNISPSDADDAGQGQKVMLSTSKIRTYADPRTFGKVTLIQ